MFKAWTLGIGLLIKFFTDWHLHLSTDTPADILAAKLVDSSALKFLGMPPVRESIRFLSELENWSNSMKFD